MGTLFGTMGLLLAVCYGTLAAVVVANQRVNQRVRSKAARITDLADRRRWDQARIEARKGGALTQPLLAALREDGWDRPPPRVLLAGSWAVVAAVLAGPLLVITRTVDLAHPRTAEALVALGLLLPAAAGVAAHAWLCHRSRWRELRGRALHLLSAQLEGWLERDRTDALQRGWASRDPRGE